MSMTTTSPAASLMPASNAPTLEGMMQFANMMARAKQVPKHLQAEPGDCLLVVEQAYRWGMSPFAVAGCTSVIQGKLMFEGKLVAAAVHASGVLDGRLDYAFTGEGETRKIIVSGHIRGEAKPRTVEVTFRDARTTNGMWTKQPDQQLVYHGARVWARRHTPEVMLGVYTPEEFDSPAHTGTVEAEPLRVETAHDPATGEVHAPVNGWMDKLKALEAEFRGCATPHDVEDVIEGERVQTMLTTAPTNARKRLDVMLQAARNGDFSDTPADREQADA